MAAELYTACYENSFKTSSAYVYDQLDWNDEDVEALCKVLESEPLPEAKQLWLSHNQITEVGLARLTAMLQKTEVLDSLEILDLKGIPEPSEMAKNKLREARDGVEVFFTHKILGNGVFD